MAANIEDREVEEGGLDERIIVEEEEINTRELNRVRRSKRIQIMGRRNMKEKHYNLRADVQNVSQLMQLQDGTIGVCHMKQVTVHADLSENLNGLQSNKKLNSSPKNHRRRRSKSKRLHRGKRTQAPVIHTQSQLNCCNKNSVNGKEPCTTNNIGGLSKFCPKAAVKAFPESQISRLLCQERSNPIVNLFQLYEGDNLSDVHRMTASEDYPCSQSRPHFSKEDPPQQKDCVWHAENVRHASEYHSQPNLLTHQQINTYYQQINTYCQENITTGNPMNSHLPPNAEIPEINHMGNHSSTHNSCFSRIVPYFQDPLLKEYCFPNNARDNVINHPGYFPNQSHVPLNLNHLYYPVQIADPLYQHHTRESPYDSRRMPPFQQTEMALPSCQHQLPRSSLFPSHAPCNNPHVHHDTNIFTPSHHCATGIENMVQVVEQICNAKTFTHI